MLGLAIARAKGNRWPPSKGAPGTDTYGHSKIVPALVRNTGQGHETARSAWRSRDLIYRGSPSNRNPRTGSELLRGSTGFVGRKRDPARVGRSSAGANQNRCGEQGQILSISMSWV